MERIEPIEDGWLTSATLITTLVNMFGGNVNRKDVYPWLGEERKKKQQTDEEMMLNLNLFAAFHNGIIERQNGTSR